MQAANTVNVRLGSLLTGGKQRTRATNMAQQSNNQDQRKATGMDIDANMKARQVRKGQAEYFPLVRFPFFIEHEPMSRDGV